MRLSDCRKKKNGLQRILYGNLLRIDFFRIVTIEIAQWLLFCYYATLLCLLYNRYFWIYHKTIEGRARGLFRNTDI